MMKVKRHQNKNIILAIHIIVWAAILMLPFIFTTENEGTHDRDFLAFRNLDHTTNFLWMGMFYLNAGVLIPRFFYKRKYLLYIGSVLLSFLIIMILHGVLFFLFVPKHQFGFFRSSQHNSIPFLFTLLLSLAYKIIYDRFKNESEAASLQRENLRTELAFLRSQISPHFLFNVLNNIVAMVRLKSEELEPTVIKLSSLLQYMLYDSDDEKVLLKNEIESLQNYIDLQKLRFTSKLNLQVHINVIEEWHALEPMLLIPFVENAFKHGNAIMENPEIIIVLDVANNELDFTVRNKYTNKETIKDKTSGIGLVNVKRRLDLLYPKTHQLRIENSGEWYTVHLKLFLK
ncbi:MAG TPA: histidine kinase [Puia sp.]|jgi:two-component system LytT family sensor kinase|nr:histidine kinase [Puia sp.]